MTLSILQPIAEVRSPDLHIVVRGKSYQPRFYCHALCASINHSLRLR